MIDPSIRAVSIDAAGTLLLPRHRVAEVYHAHALRHGGACTVDEIASALPVAMRELRSLRTGDRSWRAYWAAVIARSTGCGAPTLLDALYDHYTDPAAWRLADGAELVLAELRARGRAIAVVSNWDERLRATMARLGVLDRIDALVVSAELGVEKPDPRIFRHACTALGVLPHELVHIGDDDDDDLAGARAAGCAALHVDRDLGGLAMLSRLL